MKLKEILPRKVQTDFGELSPTQLKIINDKESEHIVVAATRVEDIDLVHNYIID